MKLIDNNLLTAYLEGSLSEKESLFVEQAIEEDDELKMVVDEWISLVTMFYSKEEIENDRLLREEGCRRISKVMEQIKNGNTVANEQDEIIKKRKRGEKNRLFTLKRTLVATSFLAVIGITALWMTNRSNNSVVTNNDVPMGFDYMNSSEKGCTVIQTQDSNKMSQKLPTE